MLKPKFLVLAGEGINCELETATAFNEGGALVSIITINDLLKNKALLNDFQGLAIPGGFSFGDELGAGRVLALKIKHGLEQELAQFVAVRKPIIGICNGFQVLAQLGLLPQADFHRNLTLSPNISGRFENRWCSLNVEKTHCWWTEFRESKDLIELPARHGEGRVVLEDSLNTLEFKEKYVALSYQNNFNGSHFSAAGVTDETGSILGLMPHPEAFIYGQQYYKSKRWGEESGDGLRIFKSIVKKLNEM